MPTLDPAALAQLAGSVPSGLVGSIGNISSAITNWQNQKFSSDMYKRSYRDNLAFWDKQNEYNTPANQMQRFRDAGLNPHLIYGQGNAGNAAPIPTPDTLPVQFRGPDIKDGTNFDGMGMLLGQADLRIKAAQADNLESQNDVIRQDALLRALQAEREGFDLGLEKDMRETSADYRREKLRELTNQIDLSINRDAREAAKMSQDIAESMERILNMRESRKGMPIDRMRMRAQIALLRKDGTLRDVEIKLRENGINPSDPMWARYVGKFLEDWMDDSKSSDSKGVLWKMIFGK